MSAFRDSNRPALSRRVRRIAGITPVPHPRAGRSSSSGRRHPVGRLVSRRAVAPQTLSACSGYGDKGLWAVDEPHGHPGGKTSPGLFEVVGMSLSRRRRIRDGSLLVVVFACAALMLSCTAARSGRPPGSSEVPLRDSEPRVDAFGAAAIVYGHGTDELVYDSVLRIMRMPREAGDAAKEMARPVPVDAVSCSPDGSRVLVLSQRSNAHWWLVNRDGSGLRELDLSRRGTQVLDARWEPEGDSLLVVRQANDLPARTSLTREFLETGAAGVAKAQTLIPLAAGRYISSVSVSPDGRRLLVGVWDQVGHGPRMKSSLWLIPISDGPAAVSPADASWREVATDETLSFTGGVWSPDGRWIAFRGGQMTSGDRGSTSMAGHLYLVRPDGSQMHRVPGPSNRNTSSYQWFPDGRTLAFLTGSYHSESDFGRTRRLALLRVDSGRGPVLTDRQDLDGYVLSPDGRAILALVGDNLLVERIAPAGRPQVIDTAGYFGGWSWCAQGHSR